MFKKVFISAALALSSLNAFANVSDLKTLLDAEHTIEKKFNVTIDYINVTPFNPYTFYFITEDTKYLYDMSSGLLIEGDLINVDKGKNIGKIMAKQAVIEKLYKEEERKAQAIITKAKLDAQSSIQAAFTQANFDISASIVNIDKDKVNTDVSSPIPLFSQAQSDLLHIKAKDAKHVQTSPQADAKSTAEAPTVESDPKPKKKLKINLSGIEKISELQLERSPARIEHLESEQVVASTSANTAPLHEVVNTGTSSQPHAQPVNGAETMLSDDPKIQGRLNMIKSMKEAENKIPNSVSVNYPAYEEEKYRLTVFTDITCPYCQKLHEILPQLNQKGITVRYMPFPRQGLNSVAARRMAGAYCADDPALAFDEAFAGVYRNNSIDCRPEFKLGYKIGNIVNVPGTPLMIGSKGQYIAGYRSTDQLLEILQEHDEFLAKYQ